MIGDDKMKKKRFSFSVCLSQTLSVCNDVKAKNTELCGICERRC